MDVRSLFAAQKYAALKPATDPSENAGHVTELAKSAANSFEETLRNSEELAQKSMTTDADPHALVHALAQTELAVEAVVTLRNKVVEAYQEILRMPV